MRTGSLMGKLVPSLMNALRALYSQHAAKGLNLSIEQQKRSYELLKEIAVTVSLSEGIHCDPTKIFAEEKLIFELIEYIASALAEHCSLAQYFDFLLQFLHFRPDIMHTDAFTRKAMEIFKNCITLQGIDMKLLKQLVPKLYEKLEDVAELRFDSGACKVLLANAQSSQSLWHVVIRYFVSISTFLVNPKLCESTGNVNEKYVEEVEADKELEKLAWKCILQFINKVNDSSEGSLGRLSKELVDPVVKINQELNSILLAFIGNILLPSSVELSRELQECLITLINSGCSSSGSFLSRFCMDTLLGLCAKENAGKLSEMRRKMAGLAAVALINKCKELLRQYIEDERSSKEAALPE